MAKETLLQPDLLKIETVQAFARHCNDYIALLEQAEAADPAYFPGRAQKLKVGLEMMGLNKPELSTDRVVIHGDAMAVLPDKPTLDEYTLASYLTRITDEVTKSHRRRYGLLKLDQIPIVTFFVRSTDEIEKIARNAKFASVISLNYPPLWNTFNLEAANWTFNHLKEQLGEEIAAKTIFYSKTHEDGHLVFEQHRMAQSRLQGFSDHDFAKTFHKVYSRNSIIWEMAANEFGNSAQETTNTAGLPIFPNMIASLIDNPDPRISLQEIIAHGNIDLFEDVETMYRIDPVTRRETPFVTSPDCAHVYLGLQRWADEHNVVWATLLKDYIDHTPLAERELPLLGVNRD